MRARERAFRPREAARARCIAVRRRSTSGVTPARGRHAARTPRRRAARDWGGPRCTRARAHDGRRRRSPSPAAIVTTARRGAPGRALAVVAPCRPLTRPGGRAARHRHRAMFSREHVAHVVASRRRRRARDVAGARRAPRTSSIAPRRRPPTDGDARRTRATRGHGLEARLARGSRRRAGGGRRRFSASNALDAACAHMRCHSAGGGGATPLMAAEARGGGDGARGGGAGELARRPRRVPATAARVRAGDSRDAWALRAARLGRGRTMGRPRADGARAGEGRGGGGDVRRRADAARVSGGRPRRRPTGREASAASPRASSSLGRAAGPTRGSPGGTSRRRGSTAWVRRQPTPIGRRAANPRGRPIFARCAMRARAPPSDGSSSIATAVPSAPSSPSLSPRGQRSCERARRLHDRSTPRAVRQAALARQVRPRLASRQQHELGSPKTARDARASGAARAHSGAATQGRNAPFPPMPVQITNTLERRAAAASPANARRWAAEAAAAPVASARAPRDAAMASAGGAARMLKRQSASAPTSASPQVEPAWRAKILAAGRARRRTPAAELAPVVRRSRRRRARARALEGAPIVAAQRSPARALAS